MGLIYGVIGAFVLAVIGSLIYGIFFVIEILFNSFSRSTLEIVCLIPFGLALSYIVGVGIQDFMQRRRASN